MFADYRSAVHPAPSTRLTIKRDRERPHGDRHGPAGPTLPAMSHPTPNTSNPRARGLPLTRLEAFSDGVFSIAITLLVLEIAVPIAAEQDLLGALAGSWPSYLGDVISFLTIGWVWIGHAAITSQMERADGLFLRINLLLLLVVAFLPFPTRLMADYFGNSQPGAGRRRLLWPRLGDDRRPSRSGLWRYARTHARASPQRGEPGRGHDGLPEKATARSHRAAPGDRGRRRGPDARRPLLMAVSAFLVIPFREILAAICGPRSSGGR